jgi:hypothetical protein
MRAAVAAGAPTRLHLLAPAAGLGYYSPMVPPEPGLPHAGPHLPMGHMAGPMAPPRGGGGPPSPGLGPVGGGLGVGSGAAATGSKGLSITDPKTSSKLDPLTKVWRHPCTRPGAVTGQACGVHVGVWAGLAGAGIGALGCSDPPPPPHPTLTHTHTVPLAH